MGLIAGSLLIFCFPSLLVGLFWLYLYKKGRQSVRWLALTTFLFTIGITLVVWIDVRVNLILLGGLLAASVGGISTLRLPKTNPEIMKKLRMKW